MNLQKTLTIWITLILVVAASITLALTTAMFLRSTGASLERNLANTAEAAARLPEIADHLGGSPFDGVIQHRIQQILDSTRDVDQIVVCDMNRIRYSHTNLFLIGLPYTGPEADAVLERGKRYVAEMDTEQGGFTRYFVPVMKDGRQIGFVAAGTLTERIRTENRGTLLSAVMYLVIGSGIGSIAAFFLAKKIKALLLGLEPDQLAALYREHTGMVEALHEGVIAINRHGAVSMANERARSLLGVPSGAIEGKPVAAIVPGSHLPTVMETGEAEYDGELLANGRVLITNTVPIREKDAVVGAVATFQDKTEVVRLAEELTGTRQLVEALRASSHEFSNKLHVILGLLELGNVDQAKQYVMDTQSTHGALNRRVLGAFKDPTIAGLMLGKFSAAREQGVTLEIAGSSGMGKIDDPVLAHGLVTILGNLVDNAIDSAKGVRDRQGRVEVELREERGALHLRVEDNGCGILPSQSASIYKRGFSTKGKNRGTGLYLVKQEIDALGGRVSATSTNGVTTFAVVLPMQRSEP